MSARDRQVKEQENFGRSLAVRHSRTRTRGQSLVELAITLPVLLLLLFGTIDLGRAFFDYVQMRNGAFEGARYGARLPNDTSGITAAVMSHGVPSDTAVAVSLSGDWNTIGGNAAIKVTATRTFTPITTGFLNSFFGIGPFVLKATATMKVMT